MSKPKVYIVDGGAFHHNVMNLFTRLGYFLCDDMKNSDVVVFTGGADICPTLYGDKAHPYTSCSPNRCKYESEMYRVAVDMKKAIAGICRGAQLINVMNGGRMYQHVTRHSGDHMMLDHDTGEEILVSSIHHQMCIPTKEAIIIGTSEQHGERHWYENTEYKHDISDRDIEALVYNATRSFGFQPHPELNGEEYQGMKDFFNRNIRKYLLGE